MGGFVLNSAGEVLVVKELASGAQAILADITKLRAGAWAAFALIMCSMAVLVDVMVETEMFAFLFFLAFGLFILIGGVVYAIVRARSLGLPPSPGRLVCGHYRARARSLPGSQVIQRVVLGTLHNTVLGAVDEVWSRARCSRSPNSQTLRIRIPPSSPQRALLLRSSRAVAARRLPRSTAPP